MQPNFAFMVHYKCVAEEWLSESPRKMDYKSLPEKNRFTFKWRFKYLFALYNESEQILTLCIKPKVHTSYFTFLIFFLPYSSIICFWSSKRFQSYIHNKEKYDHFPGLCLDRFVSQKLIVNPQDRFCFKQMKT